MIGATAVPISAGHARAAPPLSQTEALPHAGTDLPANRQSIAIVFVISVRSLPLGSLGLGWQRDVIPAIFLSLARLEQASRKAACLGTILA
jgi:hypothetical protein